MDRNLERVCKRFHLEFGRRPKAWEMTMIEVLGTADDATRGMVLVELFDRLDTELFENIVAAARDFKDGTDAYYHVETDPTMARPLGLRESKISPYIPAPCPLFKR